jgi:CxxC-x17-CxxC domain-containing protein
MEQRTPGEEQQPHPAQSEKRSSRSERAPEKKPSTGGRNRRQKHAAVCAACQRETTVSFLPRPDRPVYSVLRSYWTE